MKTETIEYKLKDEDGNEYPVICTVIYKRSKLGTTNSERDPVGERQEYHSGIDRD